MARRKEDWFPERPQDAISFSVSLEQKGQILDLLSNGRDAEQVGDDPKQTIRAQKFGELHNHWKVRGQSVFLHSVPVWSQAEPREIRHSVDLSRTTARRLMKRVFAV